VAVVMLAIGSRGDVQPPAVLAAALTGRGVPVRVVALAEYAGLVAGLAPAAEFVPVAGALADAVRRGGWSELLTRSAPGQLELLRRWTARMAPSAVSAALDAARPGDALLAGVLARGVAAALAEARGCRAATLVYTGQLPTLRRESHFFAPWFTGWAAYDAWGVRTNWRLANAAGGALTREARRALGLPRAGLRRATADADAHPILLAASPVLVPPAPDWPEGTRQTGYLAPPAGPVAADPELAAFLDAPEPPVYVGFGSLGHFGTDAEFALIVRAAGMSGRRVVTPAPPGRPPGPAGPGVLALAPVPHRWLFARVAATVHHGGSGTTHEALLAGVPSAAVPFGVDQPYHGRRLRELGVGPAPVPLRRLTAARLAALIRDLTVGTDAARYRARAAEVAAEVRREDGVAAAVALLRAWGWIPG